MGRFELLEHTADIGVVATADTFANALSWLAKGMFSIMTDLDRIEPRDSIKVWVRSQDEECLAVDWLNELLYRFEAEGFLPREFQVIVHDCNNSLMAICTGEALDLDRHQAFTMVKAATYHDIRVSHLTEWRIQIILDM